MYKIEVFWNDVEEAPSLFNNVHDWCVDEGCLCIRISNCKRILIPISNVKYVEHVEVKE